MAVQVRLEKFVVSKRIFHMTRPTFFCNTADGAVRKIFLLEGLIDSIREWIGLMCSLLFLVAYMCELYKVNSLSLTIPKTLKPNLDSPHCASNERAAAYGELYNLLIGFVRTAYT